MVLPIVELYRRIIHGLFALSTVYIFFHKLSSSPSSSSPPSLTVLHKLPLPFQSLPQPINLSNSSHSFHPSPISHHHHAFHPPPPPQSPPPRPLHPRQPPKTSNQPHHRPRLRPPTWRGRHDSKLRIDTRISGTNLLRRRPRQLHPRRLHRCRIPRSVLLQSEGDLRG